MIFLEFKRFDLIFQVRLVFFEPYTVRSVVAHAVVPVPQHGISCVGELHGLAQAERFCPEASLGVQEADFP